jgi:hypothetical protein
MARTRGGRTAKRLLALATALGIGIGMTSAVRASAAATLTISPPTLKVAVEHSAYSVGLSASGGTAPYTFALVSGSWPAGVSLSPSGTVSGTPSVVGRFVVTVGASDSLGDSGQHTYTLTVQSPYQHAVMVDHPVAYYRLGERVGATVMIDSSTGRHSGTYAGGGGYTLRSAGAIPDDTNTAVSDNGNAAGVGLGSGTALPSGNAARTIETFYRAPTGSTQQTALVDWGTGSHLNVLGLCVWGGTTVTADYYQGYQEFSTPAAINLTDGNWHLIDLTWDGTMLHAYADGRHLGDAAPDGPLNTSPSTGLRIGYWVDTVINKPTVGGLDEVAVYGTALPAKRIAAHWAARSR